MAEIIAIAENKIKIGNDDGKIITVEKDILDFANPQVGDIVKVYKLQDGWLVKKVNLSTSSLKSLTKKPKNGLAIAGIVFALLSLVVSTASFAGEFVASLVFCGLALAFVIPGFLTSRKTGVKKNLSIVSLVVVALALTVSVIGGYQSRGLEEIDIKGLSIKDACQKVKSVGWKVYKIRSSDYNDQTDCNNDFYKVYKYDYYTNIPSDKKVEIIYKIENQNSIPKASAEEKTSDTSASTVITEKKTEALSQAPTPSHPIKSESASSWRQVIKEYEQWVDDYVAVMKRYKANPTDAGLISQYTSMLSRINEWTDKVKNLKDNIEASEVSEYISALNRITVKMNNL
jgi:hypothetical protein